eukprot:5948311-Pyramimonas_sp.AAC.1
MGEHESAGGGPVGHKHERRRCPRADGCGAQARLHGHQPALRAALRQFGGRGGPRPQQPVAVCVKQPVVSIKQSVVCVEQSVVCVKKVRCTCQTVRCIWGVECTVAVIRTGGPVK